MYIIYRLFVLLYMLAIRLAALYSAKARRWVRGRRGWVADMQAQADVLQQKHPSASTIWFHCASLGEFEQGRPVIERFRRDHPGWIVLVSFFSPSGFEIRKNYDQADAVVYLPMDTPGNVARFLDIWSPEMAVFVKYEYWYGYIRALARQGVHTLVISAIFRPGQLFFRPYGGWFRKQLALISHFFVQDKHSADLLKKSGIKQVTISGDTRFDRVHALSKAGASIPVVESFAEGHLMLVAGSTWPKDEKLLLELLRKSRHPLRMIIAPHEVDDENIKRLQKQAGRNAVLLSETESKPPSDAKIMIIDRMGLLSRLYRFGQLAYVGGGFGQGIHNILEAATYGVPVLMGPRHEKFAEALELLKLGGVFVIHNAGDLKKTTDDILSEPGKWRALGAINKKYVEDKKGATDVIVSHLNAII